MTANEGRSILDLNPISGADNLVIPFTKISDNKVNGDGNKTDNNDETKDEQFLLLICVYIICLMSNSIELFVRHFYFTIINRKHKNN